MTVDLAAVRRVRVVGVSGSGKTHLAAQVASILDAPHLELDAVFWDDGWTHRDLDEAHRIVDDVVRAHPRGWVADGNWSSRLLGRLDPGERDGADLLVWLDHPRPLVMARVVRRTLLRGITRAELWHGNRESPRSWLRWEPEENIVRWAWVQHATLRERMAPRVAGDADGVVIRLAGRRAVRAWLRELRDAQRS